MNTSINQWYNNYIGDYMQYEDLRREAYIEAINLKGENKFVSTFGRVPWELIYSFSLFSVPSYGIDLYVMENFKRWKSLRFT